MPQYSQNVSDQIMKSGNTGSGLPWRLLMFSFVVFFLSILAYFGLSFGYSGYLESKIADKDLEIADLTKRSLLDQKMFLLIFIPDFLIIKIFLTAIFIIQKFFQLWKKLLFHLFITPALI